MGKKSAPYLHETTQQQGSNGFFNNLAKAKMQSQPQPAYGANGPLARPVEATTAQNRAANYMNQMPIQGNQADLNKAASDKLFNSWTPDQQRQFTASLASQQGFPMQPMQQQMQDKRTAAMQQMQPMQPMQQREQYRQQMQQMQPMQPMQQQMQDKRTAAMQQYNAGINQNQPSADAIRSSQLTNMMRGYNRG